MQISTAFDYIAFLEHVKCSPLSSKAEPTDDMLRLCGKHVFFLFRRVLTQTQGAY